MHIYLYTYALEERRHNIPPLICSLFGGERLGGGISIVMTHVAGGGREEMWVMSEEKGHVRSWGEGLHI